MSNKDDTFQLTRDELKLVCMVMFHLKNMHPDSIENANPPIIRDKFWQLYYKLHKEFGSMIEPK